MLAWPENRSLVNIINEASVLYLSALAAAIGFRMNLFNIGVEGQYRVAVFVAAAFAAQAFLPGYLNIVAAILVAMLAGAAWAGIAALSSGHPGRLRGDLDDHAQRDRGVPDGLPPAQGRQPRGADHRRPTQCRSRAGSPASRCSRDSVTDMYGLVFVAVLAGIGFSVLLNRTRFGFDLRATGHSRERGRGQRCRRQADGDQLHAALRRGGRPGRHAAPLRRLPQLRLDHPDRDRLRRHRGRAARPQPPARHRLRVR